METGFTIKLSNIVPRKPFFSKMKKVWGLGLHNQF